MNGSAAPSSSPQEGRFRAGRIVAEALLVAVVGIAAAFLANQVSPRGLRLTRNYFPPASAAPIVAAPAVTNAGTSISHNTPSLAARFKELGLQLIERPEVEKLFHDPRAQQNLILFVDARDEDHYAEGHIPGAMEFYPYHPEKYLGDVLPACQIAEQIIVYCTGGDCEDSQSAALFLKQAGVPGEKLFVFGGGITEWEAAKLPVENGARNSGDIHPAKE